MAVALLLGADASRTGTFPGANGKIAFVSVRDGDNEIYTVNPDGTGTAQLTVNSANDFAPSWSANGSKIAFMSARDGNDEIYVMNADGSSQTRLTNNTASDREPTWSPDGTKIAFLSFRDGNWEIYVMNADGSGQTRLTTNDVIDWDPAWSPGGAKIAFYRFVSGSADIHVMNADGTGQTAVTTGDASDTSPNWSPDGSKIVFARGGEIYEMNADGTNQVNLTNHGASDFRPAYSPDGTKIVFVSTRQVPPGEGSPIDVYTMNLDATAVTDVSGNLATDDDSPDWGPTADATPPETTITSGPPALSTSASATISFASSEAGSTFSCSADGGAPFGCTSPYTLSGLAGGRHTFQVKATDAAGNTDPSAALIQWSIDTVAAPTGATRDQFQGIIADPSPAWTIGTEGDRWVLAQTFTAGVTGTLVEVRAPIGCVLEDEQAVNGITYEIREATIGGPSAMALASEFVPVSQFRHFLSSGDPRWEPRVTFSTPATVLAGQRYAVVVDAGTDWCYWARGTDGESYAGGDHFASFAGGPFAQRVDDLPFQTFVVIDATPPTGSITKPRSGHMVWDDVAVDITAADTGTGVAKVEGQLLVGGVWQTVFEDTTNSYAGTFDSTAFANGDYEFRAVITDRAANTLTTPSIPITIENVPADRRAVLALRGDVPPTQLDPARSGGFPGRALLRATCLNVTEAAESSHISADRLTYEFEVAEGLHFSDGTPVTAASFARSLERAIAAETGNLDFVVDGVEVTAEGDTLTIQLESLRPDVLHFLETVSTCAVPEDTPLAVPTTPLPSAGPYYVDRNVAGQIVLRRNEHYAGERPQGFELYVGQVVGAEAVNEVEANNADLLLDNMPLAQAEIDRLTEAHPDRFFVKDTLGIRFVHFNAGRPLLSDVRVRKAVAAALEVDALTAIYGGLPSRRLLPPRMLGSQPHDVVLPDLAAAEQLVRDAGAYGSEIVLYIRNTPAGLEAAEAIAADLARIGLVVEIVPLPFVQLISQVREPDEPYDLVEIGWSTDNRHPRPWLEQLFRSGSPSNFSRLSSPALEAEFDAARELEGEEALDAYFELSRSLEEDIVPGAVLSTLVRADFLSDRAGCYAGNPGAETAADGVLIEQLCVDGETALDLAVAADVAEAEATRRVDIADIPASSLRFFQPPPAEGEEATPLDSIPLDSIPLDSIDIASSPLDSIPLDSIGFSAELLREAVGGVLLTSIAIEGGWEARLAGTALAGLPLQTLTLADVFEHAPELISPPADSTIEPLTLGELGLEDSPLDSIGLGALALGVLPLDSIPLDSIATDNRVRWCELVNEAIGFTCDPTNQAGLAALGGTTLMELTLRGLPLDSIPLDSIPLDSIAASLQNTPLDSIPLDSIAANLAASPLDSIPLDSIDLTATGLAAVPLDSILAPAVNSSLRSLPLDSIPNLGAIVNCSVAFSCTGKTLGDAFDDGALIAGLTLGDIAAALAGSDITLGGLNEYGEVTLADLAAGLPPGFTLRDLLALLIGNDYDWTRLDLSALDLAALGQGGTVPYTATFTATGAQLWSSVAVNVTIPADFAYVPGSADDGEQELSDPEIDGDVLTFTVRTERGTPSEIHFDLRPGIHIGQFTVAAETIRALTGTAAAGPAAINVVQTYEDNNSEETAQLLAPDTLNFSRVENGDRVDLYTIDVPPAGSQVKITGSHLTGDADLHLWAEQVGALVAAPLDSISLEGDVTYSPEIDLNDKAVTLPPETLADSPLDSISTENFQLRASSANRGTSDESLLVVSDGKGDQYVLQVTDFEGDADYMLTVEVTPPPTLPPCEPRAFAFTGSPGTLPVGYPSGLNTIFLFNKERFEKTFGPTAAADVLNAVTNLAGRSDLGIVGQVVQVDGKPEARTAADTWDADPCHPEKANAYAAEVIELAHEIMAAQPTVENVVLVGDDAQIAQARLLDESQFANERGYADAFGNVNNQTIGAFANSYMLSDDPYGDPSPASFLGRPVFVPEKALGRLVETPEQILGQIQRFTALGGHTGASVRGVTGYDFLTDGANEIADALRNGGAFTVDELIGETWTNTDVVNFVRAAARGLVSVNAHFDHNRGLPADQNAANAQNQLFTIDDFTDAASDTLLNKILQSIGCHSGLNVPNSAFTGLAATSSDWAETLLDEGAVAWVAKTTFGLGDTAIVDYDERLAVEFADRVDEMSIGEALTFAKQDYFGTVPLDLYHLKVINGTTFYGLPMTQAGEAPALSTLSASAESSGLETETDPITGFTVAKIDNTYTFGDPVAVPGNGSYFRGPDGVQTANLQPIEPIDVENVTQLELQAVGFLVTKLRDDVHSGFTTTRSRARIAESATEPTLFPGTDWPLRIARLRQVKTPDGDEDRLVLGIGRFRSGADRDHPETGDQINYVEVGGDVIYSDSTDGRLPTIANIDVRKIGPTGAFVVDAYHVMPDGTRAPAKDVVVGLRQTTGIWNFAHLVRTPDTDRWTGGLLADSEDAEVIVQVVGPNGRVAFARLKGAAVDTTPPAGSASIEITVTGEAAQNGWFAGAVTVEATGANEVSVDGAAWTAYSSAISVSGTGIHVADFRNTANGAQNSTAFGIDATDPTITITTPADGATFVVNEQVAADYSCGDSGAGVASCVGTVADGADIDTTPGTKTFTVVATDGAGNTTTATTTYVNQYVFEGFFSPLDPAALNAAKAGRTIPVKFRLKDAASQVIGDVAAVTEAVSGTIACGVGVENPVTEEPATSTAGLHFDAVEQQFVYNWATLKAWAGTCRQLAIKLNDGTTHRVNFTFK